jgi:hypothetical protein
MLPHFAQIALNEHAPNLVCHDIRGVRRYWDGLQFDGAATEGLATRRRQAWVVLLTTETPSNLFLLIF